MSSLKTLQDRFTTLDHLHHASAYLSWDEAVMMPSGGGDARAGCLATLHRLAHEIATDSVVGELIDSAKDEVSTDWEKANLNVIERQWTKSTAIPPDLVTARSLATSRCETAWRTSRPKNDWKTVRPLLEEVVNLTRQRAEILSEKLGLSLYDALLDDYEPGLRGEFVEPIFADLTRFLPEFIDEVIANQGPREELLGDYSETTQMELAKQLMPPLGFNFDRGRIDTSHHPFSCGDLWDTRITTRISSDDFLKSMYATLHETGHALYQQGLPQENYDQPVCKSLGMMMHESQSLFMEQQVCRSDGYLSFVIPIVKQSLRIYDNTSKWTINNFTRNVRHVEKGKIRVDADECTYPLHVILRYHLEKAFLLRELSLDDLPDAWVQLMKDYFGISSLEGDYTDGCMQDVHWYAGLIGYFPCYTLGSITAAQLFATYTQDFPNAENHFASGNFEHVLGWLRENIHSKGQLKPGFERIIEVTGEPLSTKAFKNHVTNRYLN